MPKLLPLISFWVVFFPPQPAIAPEQPPIALRPIDCREWIAEALRDAGDREFYTVERIGAVELALNGSEPIDELVQLATEDSRVLGACLS